MLKHRLFCCTDSYRRQRHFQRAVISAVNVKLYAYYTTYHDNGRHHIPIKISLEEGRRPITAMEQHHILTRILLGEAIQPITAMAASHTLIKILLEEGGQLIIVMAQKHTATRMHLGMDKQYKL